jgi:hypothetical protein
MSRGPNVEADVELLVVTDAQSRPDVHYSVIRQDLSYDIEAFGEPVPGKDWFRKTCKKARGQGGGQDNLWSIGVSSSHGISFDAIPDIVAVGGLTPSIRLAKWIARLRGFDGQSGLTGWAPTYAKRERACEVLGIPFETADLDARLMIKDDDIYKAAVDTGAVPPLNFARYFIGDDSVRARMARYAELHRKSRSGDSEKPLGGSISTSVNDAFDRLDQPLSDKASTVFSYWYGAVQKSINWNVEGRTDVEIIVDLAEQVVLYFQERPSNATSDYPSFKPRNDFLFEVGFGKP